MTIVGARLKGLRESVKLYEYKPKVFENNTEMKQFIEMCFDPNSPMNDRLKQKLTEMLREVQR